MDCEKKKSCLEVRIGKCNITFRKFQVWILIPEFHVV